ncbi:MAG: 4-hydroxy-3-methylbut-2-enyl diphosphate reductase, partial [Lachnospiraceae bacterium]|nr:4-hydroxy-3-methylbut-2-enyl diphosphate reductase [Lachnospiraceae bacterium]
VEILRKTRYDVLVLNTICNATQERQQEAEQIARLVDGMIVVGGRSSSNSRKLFDICRGVCRNTIFVGSVRELSAEWFSGIRILGITAGASTPQNIIQEVQTYVRTEL